MKAETQSVHLAKMMQNHIVYPEYQLVLAPVLVSKNRLKKLKKDDVFLLGLNTLDMFLMKDDTIYANVVLDFNKTSCYLSIVKTDNKPVKSHDSKKYEMIIFSFGKIQSKEITLDHKIDISALNLKFAMLIQDHKLYAKAKLINVDNEIAMQIKEVL